jgi:hypothetical protein
MSLLLLYQIALPFKASARRAATFFGLSRRAATVEAKRAVAVQSEIRSVAPSASARLVRASEPARIVFVAVASRRNILEG